MAGSDQQREGGKGAAASRTERLDAELRANLKKRKEQARGRAAKANRPPHGPDDTGEA